MKKAKITKEKEEIAEDWRKNHGAATFDLKNESIILNDGGLFSIEQKPAMRHKFIRFKKIPILNINGKKLKGCSEAVFSKKEYKAFDFYANIWIGDLEETILYLKSMSRMLRKLGFNTSRSLHPKKSFIKRLNKIRNKNENRKNKRNT